MHSNSSIDRRYLSKYYALDFEKMKLIEYEGGN